MGLFYDLIDPRRKKRCTECGCLMVSGVNGDICECCLDDLRSGDSEVDE